MGKSLPGVLISVIVLVQAGERSRMQRVAMRIAARTRTVQVNNVVLHTMDSHLSATRRVKDFYEIGETCGEGATCLVQECTNRFTGTSLRCAKSKAAGIVE